MIVGAWHLAGHPSDEVVGAALARQLLLDAVEPSRDAVIAFVDAARLQIAGASG